MIEKTISIVMITYNHNLYIKQAIESVLMQKTSYNFELIICLFVNLMIVIFAWP